jgi:hypothetical protein
MNQEVVINHQAAAAATGAAQILGLLYMLATA